MLRFLQSLFDSPEKAAIRHWDALKKDINEKGGSVGYLIGFTDEWVMKRESSVFLLSGITLSETSDFDQQSIQLASLKDLCSARTNKAFKAAAGLVGKTEEELLNSDLDPSTMFTLSKEDPEYRACSGMYKYSGLFLTEADVNALENSDEFKNLQCGSVEEAREHVFSLITTRMFNEILNPTEYEPVDIIEEICAKNRVAQFFRSRAVERASALGTAFETWLDADIETLKALTKGIN
jgi:hypothetical protein